MPQFCRGGSGPEAAYPVVFADTTRDRLKPTMTGTLCRTMSRTTTRTFSRTMSRSTSRAMRRIMPRAIAHAARDTVRYSVADALVDAVEHAVEYTSAGTFSRTMTGTLTDAVALQARGISFQVTVSSCGGGLRTRSQIAEPIWVMSPPEDLRSSVFIRGSLRLRIRLRWGGGRIT
jgi:hypothetical protein